MLQGQWQTALLEATSLIEGGLLDIDVVEQALTAADSVAMELEEAIATQRETVKA